MLTRRAWLVGAPLLLASRARAQARSIAIFDGPGVGRDALAAAHRAVSGGHVRVVPVTPDDVRAGALDAHDAVLFTGGRGSFQGRALGEDGRDAVRRAVRAGLGYVGICGGAFLAMQGAAEFHKLAIVAARNATGDAWMRGIGPARLAPDDGSAPVTLHYANGPLFAIEAVPELAPPSVLARFERGYGIARHGTHPDEMRGAPALVSARFGRGGILLFSPNPTLEPARDELLVRALSAVSRGASTPLDAWASVLG